MTATRMIPPLAICIAAASMGLLSNAAGADRVFSGPQAGEITTPFKVIALVGTNEGRERDPVTENGGGAVALVFVHAVERSLVPLLKAVDQYGLLRKDLLKTEVIFLFADRIEGEQRGKAVSRSLQLKSQAGISLDGAEGPGNYGLNKECMMTILAAKGNKVTANFALVQPGISDAPAIIAALTRTCGDTNPPTMDQLSPRPAAQSGPMQNRDGGKGPEMRSATRKEGDAPASKDPFPGAVPTDPQLSSLLRQFIRPTNDDATVDKVLAEVAAHIKGNSDLTRQAVDGWTRILHFGDRYGTAHARKVGREFLDKLKSAAAKP